MEDSDKLMSQNGEELRNKLLQMKTNSTLTDIMISCGKITFSAHKCILSNSSLFFNMIFADKISQAWSQSEFDQLNMDSVADDGKVLESVIDYMYCGSIKMNDSNFGAILKTADSLVMNDLTELCLEYFNDHLKYGNALGLYFSLNDGEMSLEPSQAVMRRLRVFIEDFFYEFIIAEDQIMQMSVDQVTDLLALGIGKNFHLSNVLVFVQKWIGVRDEDSTKVLEVADRCIDLCIELHDQSRSRESMGEVFERIKDIVDLIQAFREETLARSPLPELVMEKLRQLKLQLISGSFIVKDDGTLPSQTENLDLSTDKEDGLSQVNAGTKEDPTSFNRDIGKHHATAGKPNRPASLSHSTTDDGVSKKTSKSLRSSLDKIKVKAFEKSVEERVCTFLQGQLSYIRVKQTTQPIHRRKRDNVDKPLTRTSKSPCIGDYTPTTTIPERRASVKRGKIVNEKHSLTKRRKITRDTGFGIESDTCERDTGLTGSHFDTRATDKHADNTVVDDPVVHHTNNNNDELSEYIQTTNTDKREAEQVAHGLEDDEAKFMTSPEAGTVPFKGKSIVQKRRKSTPVKSSGSPKDSMNTFQIAEDYIELLRQTDNQHTRCLVCKTDFKRGTHLIRHMSRQHKETKSWTCVKCGETYNEFKAFLNHSRTHLTDIEEHLIEESVHSDRVDYKCMICFKQFDKINSVKGHLVQHKVGLNKLKKEDEFDDETQENTTKPKLEKTGANSPQTFTCDECPASFKQQYHLKRHLHCSHSDSFPFKCDICGKRSKMRYQHTEHMARHSDDTINMNEEEKSVLCYICGATMKNQKYLKRHLNTHAEHKRYTCTICQKTYSQSVTLQVHMRKHSGVKPFQCEICSMLFAVKSNMLRHQRRHRGEKRYECDQCGKGFLMVGDLKRHYTTHTGEKNYSCRYCGKRFNCRSKVPQHERIHTGEKPYECSTCGKRFIQSGDRKRHEATHKNRVSEQQQQHRRLTLYEIANPDDLFPVAYTDERVVDTEKDPAESNGEIKNERDSKVPVNRKLVDNSVRITQGSTAGDLEKGNTATVSVNGSKRGTKPMLSNFTSMSEPENDRDQPSQMCGEDKHVADACRSASNANLIPPNEGSVDMVNVGVDAFRPTVYTRDAISSITMHDGIPRSNAPLNSTRTAAFIPDGRSQLHVRDVSRGVYVRQHNQTNPADMVLSQDQGTLDCRVKVVVVENSTPTTTYESIEIPNQDFFLQKD